MPSVANQVKLYSKSSKVLTSLMTEEQIWQLIEQLSPEQRLKIAKRILIGDPLGVNAVFNGNGNGSGTTVHSSIVIQISDSKSAEISQQLIEKVKEISPEALENLLVAIANQIKARAEAAE